MTSSLATTHTVWIYGAYGAISVVLTIWLARTLFKNGAVFLEDVFAGDPRIAHALNRLLVVGFYLLNLGYACLLLRAPQAATTIEVVEILSRKLGFLLVSLGIIHFGNLYLFHRIRRRLPTRVAAPAPLSPA
jgi:hypothetical protein